MPNSVRFSVKRYKNYSLGEIIQSDLTITIPTLLMAQASLKTPLLSRSNFAVDFYLKNMALALNYGIRTPNGFALNIRDEDADLKRIIAECFGAAASIQLAVRDFKLLWKNIKPISPRQVLRPGIRGSRRPDFICHSKNKVRLIESKGTTLEGRIGIMMDKAIIQTNGASIKGVNSFKGYAMCTYIPTIINKGTLSITVGDPDSDIADDGWILNEESHFVTETIAAIKAARYAGLHATAEMLIKIIDGENDVERSKAAKEIEVQENGRENIGGHEMIGRYVNLPSKYGHTKTWILTP